MRHNSLSSGLSNRKSCPWSVRPSVCGPHWIPFYFNSNILTLTASSSSLLPHQFEEFIVPGSLIILVHLLTFGIIVFSPLPLQGS